MPIPTDHKLYEDVKQYIYRIYDRPSAYRSGALVKEYKKRGGTFIDDDQPKNLKRWFKEDWMNVNELVGGSKEDYPTYRPTKRISSKTPALLQDIPIDRIRDQYLLKQTYKGERNLPKFIPDRRIPPSVMIGGNFFHIYP